MKIELVYWRDAYFDEEDANHDDYVVQTVGFVRETKRFLVIEHEHLPHGSGARGVTHIPHEMVLRRVPLAPVP
jgi:hypothetical protein